MLIVMLYSAVIVKFLSMVIQVGRTVQHKQENQRVILRDLSELHSLYKLCMHIYNHLLKDIYYVLIVSLPQIPSLLSDTLAPIIMNMQLKQVYLMLLVSVSTVWESNYDVTEL